jgi:hypothetical protein
MVNISKRLLLTLVVALALAALVSSKSTRKPRKLNNVYVEISEPTLETSISRKLA